MSDDTDYRKEYGIESQEFCIKSDCITDLCGFQQLAYIPIQGGCSGKLPSEVSVQTYELPIDILK